jgi:protein SCO1
MVRQKSKNGRRLKIGGAVLWAGLFAFPLISYAKRYHVQGMITSIQPEANVIVVSHHAIPGYMGAMEMPFFVKRGEDLQGLAPGAQVEFEVEVRSGTALAEKIRTKPGSTGGIVQDRGLTVKLPVSSERVSIGHPVPDFELTNQSGYPVRLSGFYGRVVVVNFIYTRCPLPEVCPRLASNFALVQRRFREQLGSELILLSVTMDPKYDTPEVLEKYSKAWGRDPKGWYFLTGSDHAIRTVADRLGLVYWPEEGSLTHTSLTCLIGRDGRLEARIDGSTYEARQLGDLIARQLEMIR